MIYGGAGFYIESYHIPSRDGGDRTTRRHLLKGGVVALTFGLAGRRGSANTLQVQTTTGTTTQQGDLWNWTYNITYKDASVDEFRDHVRTYVEAINRALEGTSSEDVRMHTCWGNYPGSPPYDIALRDVIHEFYEANVNGLIVEGANPRYQHEYKSFEEHPLPDG